MLGRSRCLVMTDYRGLSARALDQLRGKLAGLPADYLVVKNRLFKRLLEDAGLTALAPSLKGQTAVALGGDNLPGLLKALMNFMEEEGAPQVKSAVWNGDYFDQATLKKLADLPSREALLTQVLAGIQAPVTGLVGLFNQLLASLVRTLKEISGQKEVQLPVQG